MKRTANRIRELVESSQSNMLQRGIPAGSVVNQLPGVALPPGGPAGDGYPSTDHDHTAAGDGGVLTNDAHDGYSVYTEIAAPSSPASNTLRLYAKDKSTVTELFYKASDGTERDLSNAPTRAILVKSADYTVTSADHWAVILVTAADKVMTLPATSAGLLYTFVLASAGLSSGPGLSISPNAADKIMGDGITSADNKDLILTGATDREGDSVTLVGEGIDGWYIVAITGTWAREA